MSRPLDLEKVKSWLRKAQRAASGGNAQPWAVTVKSLNVHSVEFQLSVDQQYRRHPSPMDVDGIAAVMGLGCYSFYLQVVAQQDGFCLEDYSITPQASLWDMSVNLLFAQGAVEDRAYSVADLDLRWTDRTKFLRDPLPAGLRRRVNEIIERSSAITCHWLGDHRPTSVPLLRQLEYLRWCHPPLRDGLFSEISFARSPAEPGEDRKIPISQLGAPKPDQMFLSMLNRFPSLRDIVSWGPVHMISRKAVDIPLLNCADVAILQASSAQGAVCFEMGRLFQELWVEFNRSQVSFQPIGLPLIALAYWRNDSLRYAHDSWKVDLVTSVTEQFFARFHIDLKNPVIGFRVGFPTTTRLQSPRAEPQIDVTESLSHENVESRRTS